MSAAIGGEWQMNLWPERRIDSISELHKLAVDIGALWPNFNRCLFRGQSNVDWTLRPSLARELDGRGLNWFKVAKLEREMANQFRQEAHRTLPPAVLSNKDYLLNWWPLMRHYGAPTRVLDWSLSPYVALYFAVDQLWNEDGALWWFRGTAADNLMVRRFGATYHDQQRSLFESGDGDSLLSSEPPTMLFYFELKRTIERIGNQQGFFTVCLDPVADHASVLDELKTYGDGPHCGKLIVPRDRKPELLRELQLMNITGKSMFPGLDGLGRTLQELTKLSIRFGGP
jgi:hypothetical protein